MAAPVVESVSNYSWAANTSPVITKPTGLAEGDLMIAIIGTVSSIGNTVAVPSTPSGWTLWSDAFYDGASDTHRLYGFYKVADSSDVAASNFTFTCDTSDAVNCGCLMRVSGQASASEFAGYAYNDNGTGLNPTISSISLSTFTDETLLVMAWLTLDTGLSAAFAGSGYAVTGISNPTWTERSQLASSLGDNEAMVVATATSGELGTITAIEFDASESASNWIGLIAAFPTDVDVSVTPDSVSLTGTVNTPTQSADVNISVDSVAITGVVNDPTTATKGGKWTNETSPNDTWTNETYDT